MQVTFDNLEWSRPPPCIHLLATIRFGHLTSRIKCAARILLAEVPKPIARLAKILTLVWLPV